VSASLIVAQAGAKAADAGATFGTAQVLMLVTIFFLVLFAGFLAMSETALTRMSRIKATALVEDERRGAKKLFKLVNEPEKFLNSLLLLVMFCHLLASTLVGLLVEPIFGSLGVFVAVILEVAVIFIFSELGPKTYAVKNGDRAALMVAPVVSAIVNFPLIKLVSRALVVIANIILPGRVDDLPTTSEQELLAMADAAHDEDVIEKDERSMIHSIIEFGDTIVREVMKPRPDMITVEASDSIDDAMEIAIKAGFSRIPVIRESKDDIAGVVYAKDLMRAQRDGKSAQPVAAILRTAHFCPESKRVSEMMREMQAQKFHMAIVLDEYGGTAGLVTLEDLIEELIGEIVDEFDVEDPQLERLSNGDVRVTASMLIDELNELLEVDWPCVDWDTVGGLVFNKLGHVPHEGESLVFEGHTLRAERVKGRRIGRVRIARLPDLADDENDG
jgi:putative hemolysin